MERTLAYLFAMSWGAALALLAFWLTLPWRRRRLTRAGLTAPRGRGLCLALFWMFCGGMAMLTLTPRWMVEALELLVRAGVWNPAHYPFFLLGTANLTPFRTFGNLYILLGNIVMFLPFGLFPGLLWRGATWRRALGTALCVTGFIECWQLLVGRAFDIDDLLLNTLGAMCGFWLWRLFSLLAPGAGRRFHCRAGGDKSFE